MMHSPIHSHHKEHEIFAENLPPADAIEHEDGPSDDSSR